MRLPVGIIGTLAFVLIAACGGLVGAGGGLAVGWLVLQAFPGVAFERAVFGALILALPLALWVQFGLLKFVRPRLAMLERRLSRGSVVSFADVRQPFTLLLRAFSDDVMIVDRTPSTPIGFLTENRLETWIVDALRPIGPVVAVGLPGEQLPHTGAARLYLDHEVWQERVRSLIGRARATVVVVGESEGVWWEIETVLRTAAATRLALVFPLALTPERMITGFYRRDAVPKPRTPRYLLTRLDRALLDVGFAPTPEPAPGDQILILDDMRRPRFLATRMALSYYALLINPLTLALRLLCHLCPAFPWRMSLSGQNLLQEDPRAVRALGPGAARDGGPAPPEPDRRARDALNQRLEQALELLRSRRRGAMERPRLANSAMAGSGQINSLPKELAS